MNLYQRMRSQARGQWPEISIADYMAQAQFSFMGNSYGIGQTYGQPAKEQISPDYLGYVRGIYRSNGVIAACMFVRQDIFAEATFKWQPLAGGRPGALFGNTDLLPLEHPWPGARTDALLTRAILDEDLAGNFFGALRPGGRVRRMRPDWTDIVLGSYEDATAEDFMAGDIDTEVIGYLYYPGGRGVGKPQPLLPEEVMHWAQRPDPEATFRGISWLTPIITEILGDKAAMAHKLKFFEHGATTNMVVKLQEKDQTKVEGWASAFRKKQEGLENAYRTVFLGAGADVTVVGTNFEQMDFKAVQAFGETRIAAAARMHPVVVGLSGGLEGSALNAGNFGAARRITADAGFRPLWRSFCGAAETIVKVPDACRLWTDTRDCAFLREDELQAAQILQTEATAASTLINAGYEPDSVTAAIAAGDMTILVHTGLVSVQLQPPGVNLPPEGVARGVAQRALAQFANQLATGGTSPEAVAAIVSEGLAAMEIVRANAETNGHLEHPAAQALLELLPAS